MKYYRIDYTRIHSTSRLELINALGLDKVDEMEQEALETGASNEYRSSWYSYRVEAK